MDTLSCDEWAERGVRETPVQFCVNHFTNADVFHIKRSSVSLFSCGNNNNMRQHLTLKQRFDESGAAAANIEESVVTHWNSTTEMRETQPRHKGGSEAEVVHRVPSCFWCSFT